MIPGKCSPQVLVIRDLGDARAALRNAGVSAMGLELTEKKTLLRLIWVRGLGIRAANVLKQELGARGGEVAISEELYEWSGDEGDCVLIGSVTQFERLLIKLKAMPPGFQALAVSMETALHNYGDAVPVCPLGLDLTEAPVVMGILNVTPDSFSDGGEHVDVDSAVRFALEMAEEGAFFVDVGGESTQPGSDPVLLETEMDRVLPVIKALTPSLPGRVSVDTYKAKIAAAALAAGAYMVNDISALRMDPEMFAVVRDADCPVVLMHMLGQPKTMQSDPEYRDVIREVYEFFLQRLNWAVDKGLKEENLLIDPGLGFGKTTAHNVEILRHLATFRSLGRPVVVGASRKRFLGELLGIADPQERDSATAATTVMAALSGAHVVRVHRVGLNREAARLAHAIFGPRG